jgi:chromosome segregation protein
MKIKRLKLTGFKSFVDPAELRIEDGLTGVVGPNGCGKSNLLEAIRWVMGEGSAKSLRGSAMDDVIFAGTTKRPSRDFAEVSILAERGAGTGANDDDGELEIVRRIERGAGSAYRINGRDSRAKDVGLVFADAATGAHSPALVSQNKIGNVIAAKPVDRRAMLEEAAGISGLHVRRKDAEQKLRATETNLNKLTDVLTDMEARTATLKRQAKAAERYKKLSADIRIAEGKLIYTRWKEAATAADAAKAEAKAAEDAVNKAAEAQRAASAYQAQAVTKLADLRAIANQARDKANEAGHKLAALRTERAQLDARIAELAAQTARLATDREREGQLAHDAAEALTRLAQDAKTLESRIRDNEALRPTLSSQLGKAEETSRDAEVALAKALSDQAREQAEARVADAALAAAKTRLDRAMRDVTALEQQLSGLGDEAPLQQALKDANAAQTNAQAEAEAAAKAVTTAEADRDTASTARDTAQSELSSAQAALAALSSEMAALERAVQTTGGSNRALDAVKAAAGYEHALAAALGDDLDAALSGDATRLWTGSDTQTSDPALPKGTERLADHVTAPPSLARRLAQIAVVDRDDGQMLAVGQRLVTKDGKLRRWDGYVATDQGAAAAERLVRLNRLDVLRTELTAAEALVESARTAATTAQSAMEHARQASEQGRKALADAEYRDRSAARAADQAAVALERLTSRRAEMAERIERSQAEKAEANKETSSAEAARTALPDGTGTARTVMTLQQAAEAARAVVAQIKAEASTLDRGIGEDKNRLDNAQRESRDWKARSGEAARRIDEMAKRAKAAEAEAAKLADAPALMDGQIENQSQALEKLTADANAAAVAEREGENTLRQIEATLAEAGEALAQVREGRAAAVTRAENQELRRIEMGRVSGERFECPPPLLPEKAGFDPETIRSAGIESADHEKLMADRERIGPVNLIAEQELAEIEGEYAKSIVERDELTEAIARLRGSISSLNREGRARLLDAFERVNDHFKRLFETLFNGGQAHLALVDSDDPLEAGLEIFAQPPGKKLQSLTLLSGGEQALTAVALIFGLFLTNPAPICVLDEVDAPLDDANIERFCGLLDVMVKETDTRYLIVTHNAVTMSRMHRLFGVTMIEPGVSRLVSVDLGGAEALLAAE